MESPRRLSREDLLSFFIKPVDAVEKIGLEVEVGTVDPITGLSIPYEGKCGVKTLLSTLVKEFEGIPIYIGENIVGFNLQDGAQISIEHGGAIEYSSAPTTRLTDLVDALHQTIGRIADTAHYFGIALLLGGNLPFNTVDDVHWMPLPRGHIMRNYFSSLGDSGSLGSSVMGLTLSNQTTLDYTSESDMCRKLRMLAAVSPIAAALFVNSPIEKGQISRALSRRLQYWTKHDPRRCGTLSIALNNQITFNEFIDWAMELPTIFRNKGNICEPTNNRTFSSILVEGYDDGTFPALSDWVAHLSQIWTDVRLRNTLELRIADGQAFFNIPAVPAFWTGLTYHAPTCQTAWELFRGRTLEEHQTVLHDIAIKGLAAKYGQESIQELARELVKLAKQGLYAQVESGVENHRVLEYIEPLEAVVTSGKTFAEHCIERWNGDLQRRPDYYVEAYKI